MAELGYPELDFSNWAGVFASAKTPQPLLEKINATLQKVNASQAVQARPAAQPALATQGKKYYDQVCVRCHGADGAGNEKIARIAGQQPEYLKLTLQRYRSGSGERIDPLMAANTKLMTDADIQAVVAYVSTMP